MRLCKLKKNRSPFLSASTVVSGDLRFGGFGLIRFEYSSPSQARRGAGVQLARRSLISLVAAASLTTKTYYGRVNLTVYCVKFTKR